MTVCIAAIYNNNSILGVSDRMITSGDIQFDRPQRKIISLTNSIAVMTAGNTNVQTQLYTMVTSFIKKKLDANPTKWIQVEDVATFYRDSYIQLRKELAERSVLAPYGLTYETFIKEQKVMSDEFVEDIIYRIRRYIPDSVETIVLGIDDSGPHIYIVRNDEIVWHDVIGFAAVGIGSNHALSHFMLSGYTRSASEAKALLTLHQAKKKAEVSPGVGQGTDICIVGPKPGSFYIIEPGLIGLDIVKDLDKVYKTYTKKISKLDEKTERDIVDYLSKIGTKSKKQELTPSPSASPHKSRSSRNTPSKKSVRAKSKNRS